VASTSTSGNDHVRCELDSHADTGVVGDSTALVINDYERPTRVFGYDGTTGENGLCKVVSAVVAYDHPADGQTYMLTIHQAILIPRMTAILLCPNQMRDADLLVNDEPKSYLATPTDNHHTVVIPRTDATEDPLRIHLSIRGVTSYFLVRKPTIKEYEDSPPENQLDLTSESLEWDPSTSPLAQEETKNGRFPWPSQF